MPKISLNGGPSYEGHEGLVKDAQDRVSEIDPDHQGRVPLVGESTEDGDSSLAFRAKGEESSPGNSSPRSGENENSTGETKPPDLPKRVRTTGNRSDADHEENSSAPLTGGDGKASDAKSARK